MRTTRHTHRAVTEQFYGIGIIEYSIDCTKLRKIFDLQRGSDLQRISKYHAASRGASPFSQSIFCPKPLPSFREWAVLGERSLRMRRIRL